VDSVVRHLIDTYQLEPYPEGGYYRETYRASDQVSRLADTGQRVCAASTAILYLLQGQQFSALHRIASDEVWHFYAGESLRVVTLDTASGREDLLLGANPTLTHRFQAVVPKGRWFGARLDRSCGYCLVGCTVAPGFDFRDFELGDRERLVADFPEHREIIVAMTR
jgi:predicted cupin superfamily sugar epimerase